MGEAEDSVSTKFRTHLARCEPSFAQTNCHGLTVCDRKVFKIRFVVGSSGTADVAVENGFW